jgi:hypothetical protein
LVTQRDYSTGLFYRFSLRVLSTGSLYRFSLRVLSTGSLFSIFFGLFLGTTVLIILSIYIGLVDPQVNYYQAIQSILCYAYITTIIAIFITKELWRRSGLSAEAAEQGIAALLLLRASRGSGDGAQAEGFAAGFTASFAGGLERLQGGIAKVESGIWE